jgi:hypothetical protein
MEAVCISDYISEIDSMFYTRGSSDDYDRFAQITGDSGWSWNNLQHYIRKVNWLKYVFFPESDLEHVALERTLDETSGST